MQNENTTVYRERERVTLMLISHHGATKKRHNDFLGTSVSLRLKTTNP